MTAKEAIALANSCLQRLYSENESHAIAFRLLEFYWRVNRTGYYRSPDQPLEEATVTPFRHALKQLEQHRPLQYVLGEAEFYGLPFYVDERVLIPRPETEELVQWIVDDCGQQPLRMLDIGTGSGCIAISLAKSIPVATLTAIDLSDKALEVAKKNAIRNQASVNFIQADILQLPATLSNLRFDVIVSNPPYVRESERTLMQANVLDYEPPLALFVPDSNPLLFYKAIITFAAYHLSNGGSLYLEINEALGKETQLLFGPVKWQSVQLRKDMSGRDRMLKAVKANV